MSEPVPNAITSATELVVRFGNQAMLDHATVTILKSERVGLVGRNASGNAAFVRLFRLFSSRRSFFAAKLGQRQSFVCA